MDAPNMGLSIVIGVCIVVITAVLAKIFLFGNKMIYPNLQQMFPGICLEVVNAIGGNTLIPSPSLDASMDLLPLNVVTMKKKRKMIFFYIKEYTACNFSLTDLLNDGPVLNAEKQDKKCLSLCLKSTFNWRGRFGILIKKLVDFSFGVSIEDLFTIQCGQLFLREIGNNIFLSALTDRKLNMEHYLIQQIDKRKTVLCVVKSVVIASDKIQIKETRKRDLKINVELKSSDIEPADCGADVSTERVMELNPETTLAYKVWELVVKEVNGHIMPVRTEDHSGGFIQKEIQKNRSDKPNDGDPPPPSDGDPPPPSDGDPPPPSDVEDNVAELLNDFKKILFPLHECAKAGNEYIKYSLLVLMTCSSDVLALSKILSKAEDGCLNEDKDTIDKQFINKNTVWSILTCVGVQTEDGRVLCEGKATPILTAVSYMIDAILELDNDFLNIIYDCDEQQLKTLLKIFESAVASSTATSVDVDMSSVLKEPVSSFLTRLKFTVDNDSIQPPKAKTCIVECIFCVLYCLL